jgi:hypothetical protein
MNSRARIQLQGLVAAIAVASVSLLAAAGASAATVVNGDFETGNLSGWQQSNFPPEGKGAWFAYTGTAPPLEEGIEVPPPPAGQFAAITSQTGPGTHILYQDVALEPFYAHQLSLTVYYRSAAPLATPSPETLDFESPEANQQYRIDVMKPTAPLESVNPNDILATVFATKTGDPQELGPTQIAADLTPFAGQTVRLRFVEVDNEFFFAAGVDSVAIQSTPPSNAFSFGKPKLNKRKGTARLPVNLPGSGSVKIADVKKTKKRIKAKTLAAGAAGTLKLPVIPTKNARKALKAKHKLRVKVKVTFTPTGGLAGTKTRTLVLKLAP